MKNDLLKKILPHLIAIIIFLIVSVLFCRPVLEGNVLSQTDIVGWKGMAQNAFDYKAAHGHFPLWNPSAFSGMPNYLIAMEGKSILPDISAIISLGLPKPISFFFVACICFYILCLSLRLKPVIGIVGALAFAFATYNPIIISAGHETKMFAIAYMPLLLAGIILIYEKKYWLGLALTTLGTYLQMGANHPQISYYFFIIGLAVTICYLVNWIINKEWKHAGIALGLTALAAIAGILPASLSFLVTSEYSKASIRGGKNIEIKGDSVQALKIEGLDTGYAFQYSLGKGEEVTMLMPNAYGGSMRRMNSENSNAIDKLVKRGVPEGDAMQAITSLSSFWGDPGSTAGGPLYAGAIICLLALVGFVLYKKPLRWGLLAVSVLAIMMAWGKNMPGLNYFLFDNLPLYNKFRAPSITMVIPQLVIPLMAAIGLQLLLYRERSQELLKADFKKILYAVGGLMALLVIMYLVMDYKSPMDARITDAYRDNSGSDEFGRIIVSGLKEDRKALFGAQLLRTLGFAVLLIGLLYLFMRNTLRPMAVVIILGLVTAIDLLVIDKDYLTEENYQPKDESALSLTTKTAIDEQILADKDPHFRVYNFSNISFSAEDYHTSVFHKAVGGYHPAKIRIYNDVIERYLYGNLNRALPVLNMLNAKYIITTNPQTGQEMLIPNPDAFGPCWLVKGIKIVNNDVAEIQSLGTTNLKDTAIVQQSFAGNMVQPQWDSTASIKLTKFNNDAIEYASDSRTPQFAVFSEVYYPYGWNAYIDGKKVDYVKTNYVLRGLSIPAGKHAIRFVFEPATYKKGRTLAFIGSFLILVFVLGGFYMNWRENKKKRIPESTTNKA